MLGVRTECNRGGSAIALTSISWIVLSPRYELMEARLLGSSRFEVSNRSAGIKLVPAKGITTWIKSG